ncbi:CDP-alcohol phosphatidyltransferase [Nonlabens sp. Hel1_33_55]|uniref:CDP-alcohol phosphatidyltransferase family protein n=1 Tax=Nonlabens sp. Hel1_33_55 TaxID=1336802 RepID=UPI000875D987|nr:CDP-alcohol phosphatidyltransferase family protein [Nonlabens sp. Hel1_33_55]SCY06567.1 CDP-alcohol phosphatidyltransferase [Nonlabens sp. Hel1_33_55]
MSKLPPKYQFTDLSDYGRSGGKWIAEKLEDTSFTPIHVTLLFVVSGIIAIYSILNGHYITAAFFLILKSVIDAADGELARLKKTPSYVGRYLDSVCDLLLNMFFLLAIMYVTDASWIWTVLAFIGLQLQGTLYNFYYVILRNSVDGDLTSRVRENSVPVALEGETQKMVTFFYHLYKSLYGVFDFVIYHMDSKARKCEPFPSWFMTLLSVYGLGFQLLVIALLLLFGMIQFVIPTLLGMSILIFAFIGIRKLFLK